MTWADGTVVTGSDLDSQIRDAGNFWLARPYCNVYNNAGVSCTTAISTLIPWDSEVEDNDSMHSNSVNPSRIIFQTLGVFLLRVGISWSASATGGRNFQIRLNSGGSSTGGTALLVVGSAGNALSNSNVTSSAWYYRAANDGDYCEVFATQNTGSTTSTLGGTGTGMQAMWQIA